MVTRLIAVRLAVIISKSLAVIVTLVEPATRGRPVDAEKPAHRGYNKHDSAASRSPGNLKIAPVLSEW